MKYSHTRSPEQHKQNYTTPINKPCGCTHHDWLTCIAEQTNLSRFNALLIHERCHCKCHYDDNDQQVSETVWNRRCGGRQSA